VHVVDDDRMQSRTQESIRAEDAKWMQDMQVGTRSYLELTWKNGANCTRLRRIKCDETKPSCKRYATDLIIIKGAILMTGHRCTSTGRRCDGYDYNQQALVQARPVQLLPKDILTSSIGNGTDDYYLDFFSKNIAPKIAGFYNLDFWTTTVVQLGHNEPAIRLAIQAVGSLHEAVEKQEGSTLKQVDPAILEDYNNAIRHLVQGCTNAIHVNAAVVALFVCLELLIGNEESASIHINGGLKLLRDWRRRYKSSSPEASPDSTPSSGTSSENELMDDLSSTFTRLAVHSKIFGKRMVDLKLPANDVAGIRYHFDTMVQARDEGFAIMGDGIGFISRATPLSYSDDSTKEDYFREQRETIERVLDYRRAYKDFYQREQMNLSQVQVRAGNMIQCLIICTYVWASTCLSPYQEDYDKFTGEFQEVIDLSKTIIDIPEEYFCKNLGRFQIDMGLIPSLHLVGSRCRVKSIRQDAIALLSAHHWREGLFDSFRSAQFIHMCTYLEEAAKQKLMGLEQHELDDYLPCEGARIHFVGADDSFIGINKYVGNKHGNQLLHSFYSKPYGAYGDWHVQHCYLPADPTGADIDPSQATGIKAVPGSAYKMPHIHVGHAYENTSAFPARLFLS
jgi:hypothetical protein